MGRVKRCHSRQRPPSGRSLASATMEHPDATALHYVQHWLPLSEQFVHRVVTGTERAAVVVSRTTPTNRAAFPHRPVVSLGRLLPPPRPFTPTERRLLTAALLAVAARHRVGLVHSHHGYRLRDVEGFVRRRSVPWVASLHGQDVTTHAREWPGEMLPVLPLVSTFVVPSRWLAERVVGLGVEPDRIEVIPSGVDTCHFVPTPLPDGPPEVLFVGRFVEKKGIDVLLDAWPRVRTAVPHARLRLLGFGPLEPAPGARPDGVVVERADPARRATQVRDAIARAHTVVTPSRTAADGDAETLLLVNLEAQASGRPLVTTRHAAIPEYVVEDETALVVPEADADALADALVSVLTDASLAARLAAAGPGTVADLDVVRCNARVDRLYDRLLGAVHNDSGLG